MAKRGVYERVACELELNGMEKLHVSRFLFFARCASSTSDQGSEGRGDSFSSVRNKLF